MAKAFFTPTSLDYTHEMVSASLHKLPVRKLMRNNTDKKQKMSTHNIYIDESCHLENDGLKAMSLGGVWCDKKAVKRLSEQVRQIKAAHGLSRHFEMKWTKVSPAKLAFYADVIAWFFSSPDLHFRGVVIPDKSLLNHEGLGQDHHHFYYKMIFTLLKTIFSPTHQYAIYLDIKDTRSQTMIEGLHQCLCNSQYDFNRSCIQRIQQIRSHEAELLQVGDLLIGALSYLHRGLQTSSAKQALIEQIKQLSGYSLERNTLLHEEKFNLLIWQAREFH